MFYNYGYGYYFDIYYLILVVPAVIFSMWAQAKVNSTFNEYSRVTTYSRMTGFEAARRILDANGLRDYDMLMAGWEADYPDPSGNLLPLCQGGNSSNAAAYNNEEVTNLINQQLQLSDPTQRNELMFQALDIVMAETPYVYMYYPVKNIAMNAAYEGVTMNASWIWNIHFQDVHPVG